MVAARAKANSARRDITKCRKGGGEHSILKGKEQRGGSCRRRWMQTHAKGWGRSILVYTPYYDGPPPYSTGRNKGDNRDAFPRTIRGDLLGSWEAHVNDNDLVTTGEILVAVKAAPKRRAPGPGSTPNEAL